ncbi:FecCD family ABC transporter permease [Sedimenticola thiotaurini]|uniref:Iron-siderophore ABC transporter permease n=1 Tax=Sedimenticola thiotaurini TaxID=1543721 RepID=A0A0F7K0A1_9GAMM|nr:iron ABC transporter permease [Sedimenticola thiotaurini]AKH20580.1 iron-siderophore ABC transporter permease [Sedimenticola thiotaurini]
MTTEALVGIRYRKRSRNRLLLLVLVSVALLLSLTLDVASGPGNYPIDQVLSVLFSAESQGTQLKVVIWDLRLPVALMAVAVGVMLGASGAEMQTILNNPLAEPFTLGISSAAAFGAALAIVFGVELLPFGHSALISVNAFLFALLTAYLLYLFTRLRGASSETMVLIGIALLFTFNALLGLLQYTANDAQLMQIVFWMMGSLSRATWEKLAICGLVMGLVLPFFIYRSWMLTALRLGDDRAAALGIDIQRLRMQVLVAVSLLAATAVAFVGTIGFVGLVGPHIARLLVGEDQRYFLPMSMLAGGLMMSLTSLISKSVTPGVIYPVGIVTSLIGVPFFISLILSIRRRNWS